MSVLHSNYAITRTQKGGILLFSVLVMMAALWGLRSRLRQPSCTERLSDLTATLPLRIDGLSEPTESPSGCIQKDGWIRSQTGITPLLAFDQLEWTRSSQGSQLLLQLKQGRLILSFDEVRPVRFFRWRADEITEASIPVLEKYLPPKISLHARAEGTFEAEPESMEKWKLNGKLSTDRLRFAFAPTLFPADFGSGTLDFEIRDERLLIAPSEWGSAPDLPTADRLHLEITGEIFAGNAANLGHFAMRGRVKGRQAESLLPSDLQQVARESDGSFLWKLQGALENPVLSALRPSPQPSDERLFQGSVSRIKKP